LYCSCPATSRAFSRSQKRIILLKIVLEGIRVAFEENDEGIRV
jgi:hypothetical protein